MVAAYGSWGEGQDPRACCSYERKHSIVLSTEGTILADFNVQWEPLRCDRWYDVDTEREVMRNNNNSIVSTVGTARRRCLITRLSN